MNLEILTQDLKYTVRTLFRDPGFTIVAVLILGLGMGANVAVFSVVNTLMLRPLPFPNAHELVWIAPPPTKCGLSCATYSTDAYDEFRVGTRSFQDVTGYFAFSSAGNLALKMGDAPIAATSIDVIANFFDVLGVQPAMGRLFRAEDGRNGASPVVVITDAWWRRRFNADESAKEIQRLKIGADVTASDCARNEQLDGVLDLGTGRFEQFRRSSHD